MKHQKDLENILNSNQSQEDKLQSICDYLYENVPYYNWVGFYFGDDEKQILHLGPFAGEPTEHTEIPYGRGICGQVAVSHSNFVVPDVQAEDNYLSCSIQTKAEVVIPIIKEGKNIGQLDIDSHYLDPFSPEDIEELEWLCKKLASIL